MTAASTLQKSSLFSKKYIMKLITSRTNSDKRFSLPEKNRFAWGINFIEPITLPVLLAMIPTLYHYGNNVEKLTLANLLPMLVFNGLLVIIFYFVAGVFNHFHPARTALATSIFLVFFNIYGVVYRYLIHLDVIRIKHYTLLPLMLMAAVYAILPLTKLSSSTLVKVWKNLFLIISVLVIYNVISIVPTEVSRWKNEQASTSSTAQDNLSLTESSPDIYYIILDEFAGFQAMREYWGYGEVDDFVSFLKDRGFFVAEESHGSSIDTLHQMASRLNYQEYPLGEEHIQTYFNDIADNRVMQFLKSRGYTTVVFDERKMGYPAAKSIQADYLYEYGSSATLQSGRVIYGLYFDEFGELVVNNTMLYVFAEKYKKNNPLIDQHSDMIYFTVDHIANPKVPSPKFVYVHLLLPHSPFRFDRHGEITDNDHPSNWNYYLDNYIFSINIAKLLIDKILSESDRENPPVIILQSDHGARNHSTHHEGSVILPNYPEDFKTLILYALHMPRYDTSNLPQDINPINTFPIVFNHLFDTNIVLMK